MTWPLPERFRVRLTMLSDWHVGSGTGRPGNIDRLILRDHDKLPYVPAKTLQGIWRDACELLCRGLDDGQTGCWSKLVDYLFGSQPALGPNDPTGRHKDPTQQPLASAVQIRAARIASRLRELLQKDRRLLQALTFIKPGVAIDPRSGSARTDYLRFEEMARVGTVLEAESGLRVPEKVREAASALLIASAKLVERLGGKRRRGSGGCRLEILVKVESKAGERQAIQWLRADERKAIEWLKQHPSAPDWPTVDGERAASVMEQTPPANAQDSWTIVPLRLILRGPLAVAYRVTGNVVESLDYLPGYYLLPHVTSTFPQLRAAAPAGDIIVLPAYPEKAGQRGEPVPLALFAPKGSKGLEEPKKVVNRLVESEPNGENKQLKQVREGFLSLAQPKNHLKTPKMMLTHNSVYDDYQRPSEETGGVYSYEAIAPEVVLRSELRLRRTWAQRLAANDPHWYAKLKGAVSLGRSKKDDYGDVQVQVEDPQEQLASPPTVSDNQLFVWLVSDTLLRNEQLRLEPTPETLCRELSQRLGVKLRLRASAKPTLLDALLRVRRLEPWHVGWGLPRPSLVALQAGSCAVFEVQEGTLEPQKLLELELSGIGERTAEGFGQVRFNHPILTQPFSQAAAKNVSVQQQTSTNLPVAPLTQQDQQDADQQDAGFEYARLIERECWKQEIRRACLAIAADRSRRQQLLRWKEGKPPMSQLGGLRSQLARLRKPEDAQAVLDWLDHLQKNPRRREKWPEGSLQQIETLLRNLGEIWEKILEPDNWPTLTRDAAQQLKKELWPLAVRMFFDTCIRAYKRELE